MTLYSIALFLHVLGALGFFAALALEWTSLGALRRAETVEQARPWIALFRALGRMYPASMVTILLAGAYMTATVWGLVAWIAVALGAMVLVWVFGAALSGPRLGAAARAVAAEQGSLSAAAREALRDPLLLASIRLRGAIGLGIIFLMTVKPELIGSLLAIGVCALLGLVPALLARRAEVSATA
jgi:hypothetical protein